MSDTLDDALLSIETLAPDMILLDARFNNGPSVAARLCEARGAAQVVAVALEETEDNILDWAEAGIAGYVADTASIADYPRLLQQIRLGQQPCPSRVFGGLLRQIGRIGRQSKSRMPVALADLTPRERMIQGYVGAGLTNKDIARRLNISVGTTKSHVHNILGKLKLTNRAQMAARCTGLGRNFEDTYMHGRPEFAGDQDTI